MGILTINKSDAGKPVRLSHADTLAVELAENPTTGYRWELEHYDESVLRLAEDDYVPGDEHGIGSAGSRRFTFRAVGAGATPLRIKLRRAWEDESSVRERFDVSVVVQ